MVSTSGRYAGKILFLVAVALLVAVGVAEARTGGKVVAKGSVVPNSGGKLAYAQGNAVGPTVIFAKVTTSPAQKVTLKWTLSCTKSSTLNTDGYDESYVSTPGEKTVTSPSTTTLPMPFAKPKVCSFSVYAFLSRKAKTTTLQVLQT